MASRRTSPSTKVAEILAKISVSPGRMSGHKVFVTGARFSRPVGGSMLKDLLSQDCLERFERNASIGRKPSTVKQYKIRAKSFIEEEGLVGCTRRELRRRKGAIALRNHIRKQEPVSRRWMYHALHCFWTEGLELPWPLTERDMGETETVGSRDPPETDMVKRWAEALSHEQDIYHKLLWLLIAQFGWRPSHVARILWEDAKRDNTGKPTSIIANGKERDFKKNACIQARLPPNVAETLDTFDKSYQHSSTDPICPWMSLKGRIEASRQQNTAALEAHWERIQRKWNLPPLVMAQMRHFAVSACDRAGLSDCSTARLLGHSLRSGRAARRGYSMRNQYGNLSTEYVLAEQANKLPDGCLGVLGLSEVRAVDDVTREVMVLWRDYKEGHLRIIEAIDRLEELKTRALKGDLSAGT